MLSVDKVTIEEILPGPEVVLEVTPAVYKKNLVPLQTLKRRLRQSNLKGDQYQWLQP
jgi:hypothetical protein